MTREIAFKDLCTVLSDLNPSEVESFMYDLFTTAEIEDISLRWALMNDLVQAVPQRKIADRYNISLCKITKGSAVLKKKNGLIGNILKARYDERVR